MGTSTDAITGWGVAYEDQIYGEEDEDGAHCSCECPQPYVFIAESYQRAWRGSVVDVESREPGADWGERIEKAIALLTARFKKGDAGTVYDFETDQPRGWKLVAWWC